MTQRDDLFAARKRLMDATSPPWLPAIAYRESPEVGARVCRGEQVEMESDNGHRYVIGFVGDFELRVLVHLNPEAELGDGVRARIVAGAGGE